MRPTAKDHKFRVFLEQRRTGYVVAVPFGKLDGGYRVPAMISGTGMARTVTLKANAGAAATGVRVSAGPARRRPDVVTREGGVATAPLQVEYDAPDNQSNDWDQNDQKYRHHDLFPEVFSAYTPKRLWEFEHFDFVQQQSAATVPYGSDSM